MASSVFWRVCLALAVSVHPSAQWQNDWDGPLRLYCSSHQYIYRIQSVHNNHREDRQWEYSCRDAGGATEQCSFTDYVNDYDEIMNFKCSNSRIVSGVRSVHDNKREDRRFVFMCCEVHNKVPIECVQTPWINDYDEPMDYILGKGQVLIGAYSEHDNHREDRRWKLQVCNLRYKVSTRQRPFLSEMTL